MIMNPEAPTPDDDAGFKAMMADMGETGPLPPAIKNRTPIDTAAPASNDDAGYNAMMADINGGASKKAGPRGGGPAPARPQQLKSRYRQAGEAAPQERELSLGEAFQGAGRNFIPSTVEMGKGMISAVTHPKETLGAIGGIGSGLLSQTMGVLGAQQDPTKKAHDEALAKALEGHYAQTYGSYKGFKKALNTDPASIAMDLSTLVLGPAGAAAKGAGLTKTAAGLGKLAELTDPVQLALKAAKIPFKAAGKIVPYAQSLSSGASVSSLAKAAEAASSRATPEERAAFQAHINKKADPSEIVGAMDNALDEIAKKRSTDYIDSRKAMFGGTLPPLSFQNISDALKTRIQENRLTDPITGFVGVKNPNVEKVMKEIGQEIKRYSSQPVNSMAHTLEGFDALKQRINAIRKNYRGDPQAYQAATAMHKEILKELISKEPEYGKLMSQYSNASDEMAAIRERFGVGKNLSDETVLKKVLKSKFGKGKDSENLLSALAQHDSRIPYMIAGHELSDIMPGGLRQALMYSAPFNPAGIVGGAAHLAASSPKVMGGLNYAAGTAGRHIESLTRPAITKPLTYIGQQEDGGAPTPKSLSEERPTSFSSVKFRGPAPVITGDPTYDAMLHQESGGHQFKDGSPLVSSAGAIGAAQVMPSTGPEAARLAGEPWDLERLKTDPDYNVKLGKAYFDSLVTKYGDPLLAAAHYNGGGVQVERAVKMAQENGGSWVDYLTANETKNYVKNVASRIAAATGGRIQRASGGRIDSGRHEALVNKLMKKAERAKSVSNKVTEPLLEVPDKAIVKALDMAQQAI